jgi:hypothetical protein
MGETRLYFGNDVSIPVNVPTDVQDHLPPDKRYLFSPGRSMALAANSWVNAKRELPKAIAEVVGSDVLDSAHFEYGVAVYGRGLSMTDVMAFTVDAVIAVEAQAREPFGSVVWDWIDEDQAKNANSPPYRCKVIAEYAQAFGVRFKNLLPLRYQLFHRTLSAALTAQKTGRQRAWMVVQSFAPLNSDEHAQNRSDFDRFVAVVGETSILQNFPVRLAWVDEPVA